MVQIKLMYGVQMNNIVRPAAMKQMCLFFVSRDTGAFRLEDLYVEGMEKTQMIGEIFPTHRAAGSEGLCALDGYASYRLHLTNR